jgi:hypothetical protein
MQVKVLSVALLAASTLVRLWAETMPARARTMVLLNNIVQSVW